MSIIQNIILGVLMFLAVGSVCALIGIFNNYTVQERCCTNDSITYHWCVQPQDDMTKQTYEKYYINYYTPDEYVEKYCK